MSIERSPDLYTTDLKIDFVNVQWDEHSLALIKKGKPGQRYAVVDWVDEKGVIYRYCRPTMEMVLNETKEQRKERVTKFLQETGFNQKDLVEPAFDDRTPGLVHQGVIAAVKQYYEITDTPKPDYIESATSKHMGSSFYKIDDHNLDWIYRSTVNMEVFKAQELAIYCLYFAEKTFNRPKYTNAFHIRRTIPWDEAKMMSDASRLTLIKAWPFEDKKSEQADEIIQIKTSANISRKYTFHVDEWKKIYNNNKAIAEHLMTTIYTAAGLTAHVPGGWPQSPDDVLINNVLRVAVENNIKLVPDYLPKNFINGNNMTALMHAAQRGKTEVVNILLKMGANVNAVDPDDNTALHFAVREGNVAIVKILLEAKADIFAKEEHQETALFDAVRSGNVEIVKMLLASTSPEKRKLLIVSKNHIDENAITEALNKGKFDILVQLLKTLNPTEPNAMLRFAVAKKNVALASFVKKQMPILDSKDDGFKEREVLEREISRLEQFQHDFLAFANTALPLVPSEFQVLLKKIVEKPENYMKMVDDYEKNLVPMQALIMIFAKDLGLKEHKKELFDVAPTLILSDLRRQHLTTKKMFFDAEHPMVSVIKKELEEDEQASTPQEKLKSVLIKLDKVQGHLQQPPLNATPFAAYVETNIRVLKSIQAVRDYREKKMS